MSKSTSCSGNSSDNNVGITDNPDYLDFTDTAHLNIMEQNDTSTTTSYSEDSLDNNMDITGESNYLNSWGTNLD